MTIKYVVGTLDDEVELLQATAVFVRNYPNEKFSGSAKVIQTSWVNFLTRRASTNKSVCDHNIDKELALGTKEDMVAELDQLQKYIDVSEAKPKYSEKWREFFLCEQEILKNLLKKIK